MPNEWISICIAAMRWFSYYSAKNIAKIKKKSMQLLHYYISFEINAIYPSVFVCVSQHYFSRRVNKTCASFAFVRQFNFITLLHFLFHFLLSIFLSVYHFHWIDECIMNFMHFKHSYRNNLIAWFVFWIYRK